MRRCSTINRCSCKTNEETVEYILTICALNTKGRPAKLCLENKNTRVHIENTVKKLRDLENNP